jgi:hypothetical protein
LLLFRRKKWFNNIRRDDLRLKDIGKKKVCSVHFEPTAYNCPTDFGNSTLMSHAVPTIIDCPNPPPSDLSKRKPPTLRPPPTPKPKRKKELPQRFVDEVVVDVVAEEQVGDETEVEVLSLRLEIDHLKSDLKKKSKLLSSVQLMLSAEKQKNRVLQQKLKRRTIKVKKKDDEIVKSVKKVVAVRKSSLDELLEALPDIPRAVVQVMLLGCKRVNWAEHEKTLELALSVFFRSPAAYEQLRTSGFLLPCTRTLRNRYSEVLKAPGFCPRLLEMITLRANEMVGHEKLVTISLDGMRLTTGLSYKKHADTLIGFEDLANHGKSHKIANEGVVVMVRGVTRRWKQIIGYFVTGNFFCHFIFIIHKFIYYMMMWSCSVQTLVAEFLKLFLQEYNI